MKKTKGWSAPQEILAYLKEKGTDVDVEMERLYKMFVSSELPDDHRILQQRLGARISRLNKELAANGDTLRVKPGELKRTYRLTNEQ